MKNKPLNIYDMTQMIHINGKFYERLSPNSSKNQYRETVSVCNDQYQFVTNKTLIKKLDSIFKNIKFT